MKLRLFVLRALARKDVVRLLHNGPALMLLGLFVVVAFVLASSGLVEEKPQEASSEERSESAWIVYWGDHAWVEKLKRRAPKEFSIRFVDASQLGAESFPDSIAYPANTCVIEIRPPLYDQGRKQVRRHVRYRYPGSDPAVLWPVTRWFLSVSIEHFGKQPQFFETIQPLAARTAEDASRAALERMTVADILSRPLISTALLTAIQFFGACGLLVSLTAQERERGALRALLLTPASYFEFISAKVVVHGGLTLVTASLVMAALLPEVLGSLLFWGTISASTLGYFAVGLLISSFAKNQAAPNLLSFAYLMLIGALNLLGHRFEAFQFLSSLTFERYGLIFTLASVSRPDLSTEASLSVLGSASFQMLVLLSFGLLMIAVFVGARSMQRD
ncbi:MAG: hypothetical protein AAF517_05795 [Planctomycetota bacterium]